MLCGKPVAVVAYDSPNGCIVSPSIEAKRHGIKSGMPVREGRLLCPELIVRTPDPDKYRDVHLKFNRLFREYTPDVILKSIDEAVLDFSGTVHLDHNLMHLEPDPMLEQDRRKPLQSLQRALRNDRGEAGLPPPAQAPAGASIARVRTALN